MLSIHPVMSDDIYGDAPEETEERPVCDDCRARYARFEWDGHFVCRECLEEELEHDPALH
jgi:protein-arginine kinase activator protein McsA